MDGLRYLGCEEIVGFDFGYGTLFKTAGGIAEGAITAHEQDVVQEQLAKDEETKVTAAVAADIAAANALARADSSARAKGSSAAVDAQAAQLATAAQDKAGAALTSEAASQKRADAADKALANAVKNAQEAPKDTYKAALVRAWTVTANKAHNVSITSDSKGGKGKGKKGDGESFWTRRVVGPLPGAVVVPAGVGLAGALGYTVKRIFFK